jgi:hypothetical protein
MANKLLPFLGALTCTLALSTVASGQDILILGLNGDLNSVNPNSGQITYIGSTGAHTYFWSAMAQDSQGRLFASTGDWIVGYSIYEIDPQTGLGTFVVQTTLFGIGCMAFDSNDVLYVGNDRTFPLSTSPYDLYTLDLATGNASFIGDTGIHNMLAIDFYDGTLYGYPASLGLSTIDTNTGIATDVNPSHRGSLGSTVSMCFDDEGSLYYIDHALWMMDSETGVASAVDWADPFGFWAEAVFVEGATAKFSLWLSGTSGGQVGVKIAGATPGGQVGVAWAKGGGGPTPIPAGFPCAGVMMNLNSTMSLLGVATADATGKAMIGPQFVPSSAVGTIRVQAIDLTTCEVSNRVILAY